MFAKYSNAFQIFSHQLSVIVDDVWKEVSDECETSKLISRRKTYHCIGDYWKTLGLLDHTYATLTNYEVKFVSVGSQTCDEI